MYLGANNPLKHKDTNARSVNYVKETTKSRLCYIITLF